MPTTELLARRRPFVAPRSAKYGWRYRLVGRLDALLDRQPMPRVVLRLHD